MQLHPYFSPDTSTHPKIPYGRFYRRGMGTDGVAQFLYSMVKMVRPKRALEVGMGYTTPWLLRGLDDTSNINVDRTLDPEYFRTPYNPELICIDETVPDVPADPFIELLEHPRMRFLEGKFQGKATEISRLYGKCDFVWFDCGGPDEYTEFCDEYIPICSDYMFFHFTYLRSIPNSNHDVIFNAINADEWFFVDIVEPHRYRQGSLTMLRRKPVCTSVLEKSK